MEFDSYLEYITKLRREFHAYPELGNFEYNTQKTIIKNLKSLKIPYKKVDTGIIAYMDLGKPKTIAYRADMDALPILEVNNAPYKSKNAGIMHACGHDGHMAILLTFIKWASANKDKINSNLKFIFQPAEEGIGGAEKMIAAKALENVDEIYAVHVDPEINGGVFGLRAGLSMAGVLEFDVEFFGKSCHAADYKNGVDAIKAGLEFLNIKLPAEFTGTILHIGKIAGGCARNVVADYCKLECSFRFFEISHKEKLVNFLNTELKKFNKNGINFKINLISEYPPLINSDSCIEKVGKLCSSTVAKLRLTAEDFSYYLEKCKGALVWLGVKHERICIGDRYEPSEVYENKPSERLRSEAKQSCASPKSRISVYVPVGNLPPVTRLRRAYSFMGKEDMRKYGKNAGLHSNNFDFNEKYLLKGVELFAKLAVLD